MAQKTKRSHSLFFLPPAALTNATITTGEVVNSSSPIKKTLPTVTLVSFRDQKGMKHMLLLTSLLIGLAACQSQKGKATAYSATAKVTEVATYDFKVGISDAEALQYAQSVNDFLTSNEGFVQRTCSRTPDGKWIDIILWKSMSDAEAAAARAAETEVCLTFFSKMDEKTSTYLLAQEQFKISK